MTPPAHQALYRRWRAQTFREIVGQQAVVETLRNAVRLDRVAHGLLFVGPRGTGKTSMARIVAKAINCSNPKDGEPCDACASCTSIREGRALDVVEMDAASNNRVDDMRELLPRVYTAAADVRRKVFIVDEVQRIKEGWDVLLKTLEEPPDDVVFIFCTTNPAQIRPAVVSRLQRYTFRPLGIEEIAGKLRRILAEEQRAADDDAIRLVADLAAGGMRDAEAMLDQLLSGAADPLTADSVRDLLGLADATAVDAFITALGNADVLGGVQVLDRLEENGRDLVAFADQVVARLREQLVARLAAGDTAAPSAGSLARVGRRLTRLDATRAGAGGYRFQLELALFEAADSSTSRTPATERPATTPVAERPAPTPATASPASADAITASPLGSMVRSPQPVDAGLDGARRARTPSKPRVAATPRAESEADPSAADTTSSTSSKDASTSGDRAETPNGRSPAARVASQTTSPAAQTQSPAAQTQSPAAPAPDSAATGDALERLRRGWPEVVAQVARNPANRPLIAACRPVEVHENVVVLGFPEDQAFLRDIAERKRSALEGGVRAVLGPSYIVRCVAANVDALAPLESEGSVDLVEQARRIFEDELVDVAEIR